MRTLAKQKKVEKNYKKLDPVARPNNNRNDQGLHIQEC